MSRYWLHPEAEAELGDAALYYATHASKAIATAFLAEFETVVERLLENPQRGPRSAPGLRSYHFSRIPYTVIYSEDTGSGLQILAIAHQRRAPGYWGERKTP